MAGERAGAIEHYLAAAGRTTSVPERDYLLMKAAKLAPRPSGPELRTSGGERPDPREA
jgi:hypothetical protein